MENMGLSKYGDNQKTETLDLEFVVKIDQAQGLSRDWRKRNKMISCF